MGRLLDHCGVGRAHLVVHDFGGPWGLAWAAEHPGSLASVTLIDTGVLGRGGGIATPGPLLTSLMEQDIVDADFPYLMATRGHGGPR